MNKRIPTEDLVADPIAALRGMAEARRQLASQAENGYERQLHERVLAEYERRIQECFRRPPNRITASRTAAAFPSYPSEHADGAMGTRLVAIGE